MDENEESSVNVTNNSEDSNVGEGLINCYGSPGEYLMLPNANSI